MRKYERQKHRTNLKGDDSETQYRVRDVEPLVEGVLCQIEARFTNHNKKALSLGFILWKLSGEESV